MGNRVVFSVSASPSVVSAYLSNPRNVLIANHEGPVVERSDPPVGAGSWSVLAFDQLRARVEYTRYEPPDVIAVGVAYSGRGSGGMTQSATYRLEPDDSTGGTKVTLAVDGSSGLMIRAFNQVTWPLVWRRLRDRMERGAV
jgi:hypothetical protein